MMFIILNIPIPPSIYISVLRRSLSVLIYPLVVNMSSAFRVFWTFFPDYAFQYFKLCFFFLIFSICVLFSLILSKVIFLFTLNVDFSTFFHRITSVLIQCYSSSVQRTLPYRRIDITKLARTIFVVSNDISGFLILYNIV